MLKHIKRGHFPSNPFESAYKERLDNDLISLTIDERDAQSLPKWAAQADKAVPHMGLELVQKWLSLSHQQIPDTVEWTDDFFRQ